MEKVTIEERGHWASKTEFLLAVAGNVVGLGNVWRFPYLCYKNGGGTRIILTFHLSSDKESCILVFPPPYVPVVLGAFLVPYMVFVVTCGVPLFLLETAIGQYTQEGSITVWKKLCPLAEGNQFTLWCRLLLRNATKCKYPELWHTWVILRNDDASK